MLNNIFNQDNQDNNIDEGFGCPRCKELSTDKLLINDEDEVIECMTCGCKYELVY